MKKYFLLLIIPIFIGNIPLTAQGVSINDDGSEPSESAILDLKSTSKGFLLPRLTNVQRDGIDTPVAGLMIFNTDINSLQLYNGSSWLTLTVSSCTPSQPSSITGSLFPECNETGISYSIIPVENATNYYWTVPAGATITSGQGTTDITIDFGSTSGDVSVRAESGCGNSAFQNLGVTIEIPAAPGVVTGNSHPDCNSSGETYSISPVNGSRNYNWTIPADAIITSGQGTTSITVDFGTQSGNVSVRSENSCGNSLYSDFPVTVATPDAPELITGNTDPLCSETGVTYFITAVPGATSYNWTVPADATITSGQGTTSLSVDFGTQSGNVSVRSENSCGNSAYTDLPVSVGSLTQPGSITGNEYVDCNAAGEAYSISAVTDATSYNWTVPGDATITGGQGTTGITVDFGTQSGNVSVRAENACDNSDYTDLFVSTLPEQPGSITGDIEVCRDETGVTYSIDPIAYAASYNWTIPADATITSGQGTTSITVDFGTQSGNVSVRAENACGNSSYTDLAVDVGIFIGCYYAGGVVFYIDGTGEHGLVCAVSDQSSGAEWGCVGTEITGADGTAIGTGAQNTLDIEAGCTTAGIAADICANLTLDGYNDWFLPSQDELNAMYQNRAVIDATATNNGGSNFQDIEYWSSTEENNISSINIHFLLGILAPFTKDFDSRVRAVRAF